MRYQTGTDATLGKGLYGLLVRAGHGGLLLASLMAFPTQRQSDVAASLAVVAMLNLVTNFGIPTLMLKRMKEDGGSLDRVGSLVRGYSLFSAVGFLALIPFGTVILRTDGIIFPLALMFISVSAVSGLEYWAVGRDEYREFLATGAPVQVVLGLCSGPVAAASRSLLLGFWILALSAAAPLFTRWGRNAIQDAVRAARLGVADRRWVSQSGAIALGSAGAALLYGADVFLLRWAGFLGHDARYRFATMAIGVAVGLVPSGMFVLASAASGRRFNSKTLAAYAAVASAVAAIVALTLLFLPNPLPEVGHILLALVPLAALRVLVQAMVGQAHGAGLHQAVAWSFVIASAILILAGAGIVGAAGIPGLIAVQVLVEMFLLLALRWRVSSADGHVRSKNHDHLAEGVECRGLR